MNFLLILILLPLMSSLILLFLNNEKYIKNFSIFSSFSIFIYSLFLWIIFTKYSCEFQHYNQYLWLSNYNINFCIGIDSISLFFIILTTFLIPICLLISYDNVKKKIKNYFFLFFILEFFLIITFSALDLLLFYVFFESVLLPMFLIIGIWGSRVRKIKATYYFFMYTLIGSLFMFIAIIHIYLEYGTTNYLILYNSFFNLNHQKIYWLAFFFSFAIKIPIFPFHIWLPEAHVEAPTAGSVILAGILLKLGSYGLLRFSLPLFPIASYYFTPLVFILCLISIISASFTAIRQTDLKKIIAYASIAHMNMIILGLFSFTVEGVAGSIFQMLSHGIISSSLFISIGILYDRYHTREINYFGGMAHVMPIYSVILLIYIFANISIPGTSNFVGELLILMGIFQENTVVGFIASISIILGACYSLIFYNKICFGNINFLFLKNYYDVTLKEISICIVLLFITLLMGFYPKLFLNYLHIPVFKLLSHVQLYIY